MGDGSGTAEICNFDGSIVFEEDVLGFEVSVDDLFGVHGEKGFDDLAKNGKNFINRQLLLLLDKVVEQVALFAVLHQNL